MTFGLLDPSRLPLVLQRFELAVALLISTKNTLTIGGRVTVQQAPPIQLNWIGFDQTRFCYFYVLKLLIRNQSETSCAVILIPVFSLSTFDARQQTKV